LLFPVSSRSSSMWRSCSIATTKAGNSSRNWDSVPTPKMVYTCPIADLAR
jgi:hypothetical protein